MIGQLFGAIDAVFTGIRDGIRNGLRAFVDGPLQGGGFGRKVTQQRSLLLTRAGLLLRNPRQMLDGDALHSLRLTASKRHELGQRYIADEGELRFYLHSQRVVEDAPEAHRFVANTVALGPREDYRR